jgi:hypothetical protein
MAPPLLVVVLVPAAALSPVVPVPLPPHAAPSNAMERLSATNRIIGLIFPTLSPFEIGFVVVATL